MKPGRKGFLNWYEHWLHNSWFVVAVHSVKHDRSTKMLLAKVIIWELASGNVQSYFNNYTKLYF